MWPDWLTFRPITVWPGELTPSHARKRSPFSAGLRSTVSILRHELAELQTIDGSDVLCVALAEKDLRLDGKPRAGTRPEHPGVILAFSREASTARFPSKSSARAYLRDVAQTAAPGARDEALYRLAAKHAHPDHGGDPAVWLKVVEANRLLAQDDAYQFAVDLFPTWEDNLRAIALGLEALRTVDRYGITKRAEQYTGWKQITATSGAR